MNRLIAIGAAVLVLAAPGAAAAQHHRGADHGGASARHHRGHLSVNVFAAPYGRSYRGYSYGPPYYGGYENYGGSGYEYGDGRADHYHGAYGNERGHAPRRHDRHQRRHRRGHHGH